MKKWEEPELVNLCVKRTNSEKDCGGADVNCWQEAYEGNGGYDCIHYRKPDTSLVCNYNPNSLPGQES